MNTNIDITEIIVAIIGLLGLIITGVIIPLIKSKTTNVQWENINKWSNTFVQAAEALKLNDVIDDKLNYAITALSEKCNELGYTIDIDTIEATIESSWTELTAKGIINTSVTKQTEKK